jgi:ribokinase
MPDVVVVGSLNEDLIVQTPRRPEPGETVSGAELHFAPGGKGNNQAVAAARAQAKVAMVGCVGTDEAGQRLLARLAKEGVDTSSVKVTPDAVTGTAIVTVTPDGENSIIVAPGANRILSPEAVWRARAALGETRVTVAQLEIPEPAVVAAAHAWEGLFILNASPVRSLSGELLGRTDILVVNRAEATALLGENPGVEESAIRMARELRGLGPQAVVITLGASGAVLADSHGVEHRPAPPVHPVDTTGAGDTFVGSLAARLARSPSAHDLPHDLLIEAVDVAVAAASQATLQLGAQGVFG